MFISPVFEFVFLRETLDMFDHKHKGLFLAKVFIAEALEIFNRIYLVINSMMRNLTLIFF